MAALVSRGEKESELAEVVVVGGGGGDKTQLTTVGNAA